MLVLGLAYISIINKNSRVDATNWTVFENAVEDLRTPQSKKHDEIFITRDDVKNIIHEDY